MENHCKKNRNCSLAADAGLYDSNMSCHKSLSRRIPRKMFLYSPQSQDVSEKEVPISCFCFFYEKES